MAHANARLTVHGRRLLVERVESGMPVAHVAAMMGVSRQCAHRWVNRYRTEGEAGLSDRSSRPHRSPARTPEPVEVAVCALRDTHRRGRDQIAAELGVPARTVSRILARNGRLALWALDPVTGDPIRATRTTTVRYERDTPGDLIHVDVKKLGRIPDGGGWRAWGKEMGSTYARRKARPGYDFIHSAVDDHSRLAYTEIHPDEQADTCAGFLTRAAAWFATTGIAAINQVMTDNHWSYTRSHAFGAALAGIGATHITIRPHCPWQNGKVERFNRTLATEWAYARIYTTNSQRTQALADFLTYYNTQRPHHALAGQPPITRVSPT